MYIKLTIKVFASIALFAVVIAGGQIDTNNSGSAVALKFINDYIDNAEKMNEGIGIVEWVAARHDATNGFKGEVKRIVDEAYAEDPEMGLDADPVFDAQDYDGKGMELESIDEKTGYLIVRGKEMKDFKLTMKLKEVNGKWLVDGSGFVNIPLDRRILR